MKDSDKRGEIIQAALELIAEQGFHGAPMAMIADKAGVGAGTIYRYFENKDVLITELYRKLEEKIMAALQEGYSVGKPLRERFLHLGTALLRYFIAHPLYFRYMEQYYNSPYGASMRRDKLLGKSDNRYIFKDLFEQGISQQVLKDLPILVLFALAFGPMLALARDHILGFAILDDTLIIQSIEACWDGIKR
ncbi:MAG TPA: TetR/AcrR family transcriptional regulator [Syntrophales bacterium]|nr:TetR/AcrR family transcriptional regulator [Syntrophales bacterium]